MAPHDGERDLPLYSLQSYSLVRRLFRCKRALAEHMSVTQGRVSTKTITEILQSLHAIDQRSEDCTVRTSQETKKHILAGTEKTMIRVADSLGKNGM